MRSFHAQTQESSSLYISFMFYSSRRLVRQRTVAGTAGGKKDTLNETRIDVQGGTDRTTHQNREISQFHYAAAATLTKDEVRVCIEDIGIIPSLSNLSATDALFVAETLVEVGIPVIEISMNDPEAIDIISHLVSHARETIVGAGSICNMDMARECLDAGVKFLSTDGAIPGVVEFSGNEELVAVPGALTLTEVLAAWDSGADFVKVVPCYAVGGHRYIQTLREVVPQARLVAAGGVNQQTALNYIMAGAAGLSVGKELIPQDAILLRQARRIQELARRFLTAVDTGRE
jgi:2-dehydro-3-deoxyphosphogluconate aldolase / (4S)-4-hydroxy-2-oxoglutarate aldolase